MPRALRLSWGESVFFEQGPKVLPPQAGKHDTCASVPKSAMKRKGNSLNENVFFILMIIKDKLTDLYGN